MTKTRTQLASELFSLRSTLSLWRNQASSELEFQELLDKRIKRLLSEAGADNREYVLTHVNQMFATHGWSWRYD